MDFLFKDNWAKKIDREKEEKEKEEELDRAWGDIIGRCNAMADEVGLYFDVTGKEDFYGNFTFSLRRYDSTESLFEGDIFKVEDFLAGYKRHVRNK